MKNIRCVPVFVAAYLTCLCSIHAHGAPGDSIPPIATVAGFTAGKDTIEAMKARFGAGAFVPGQHPIGGRAWELRGLGVFVAADGFYYNSHGRIVDSLGLELDDHSSVRHSHASRPSLRRLAFLGTILPGMSRHDVMAHLKGKLPPPAVVPYPSWQGGGRQVLGWHMTGKAGRTAFGKPRFTEWDARLLFDHNTLAGIEVECS